MIGAACASAFIDPARSREIDAWMRERLRASETSIEHVDLDALGGWRFDEDTGDLEHDSGRFFSVRGVEWTSDAPIAERVLQPILDQPEIGILGLLVKRVDGVLHGLVQAKVEPGNANRVQISPTVQATHSNFSRVHRGAHTMHLEHFRDGGARRTWVDSLQPEHGRFFFRKRNRNVVVETNEVIADHPDFAWLTLAELRALCLRSNLVNMNCRSVLACLWAAQSAQACEARLVDSASRSLEAQRSSARAAPPDARLVALRRTPWRLDSGRLRHDDDRLCSIVGVSIRTRSREVSHWMQPLLRVERLGEMGLVTQAHDGRLRVLVQARLQPGSLALDVLPTIHDIPGAHDRASAAPTGLRALFDAPTTRIVHDSMQSEEGGRFDHYENRYVCARIDPSVEPELPPGFFWTTLAELARLLRDTETVSVELRTLLACAAPYELGEQSEVDA